MVYKNEQDAKIFIAGPKGLVGSALIRNNKCNKKNPCNALVYFII